MKSEQKSVLGKVLKQYRESRGWTQETLEEKSGIALRTIQRAESGLGIGAGSLSILAQTFNMTAQQMLAEAVAVGPEIRITLRRMSKPKELLSLIRTKGNLVIGPPGEHPFNEHFGQWVLNLISEIEDADADRDRIDIMGARILNSAAALGFGVFGGTSFELLTVKDRSVRKATAFLVAAPPADKRILRAPKGETLDYLRDSRCSAVSEIQRGSSTLFDWMRNQLLAKMDGEEEVARVLRDLGV